MVTASLFRLENVVYHLLSAIPQAPIQSISIDPVPTIASMLPVRKLSTVAHENVDSALSESALSIQMFSPSLCAH
jgi:hypothetical protein